MTGLIGITNRQGGVFISDELLELVGSEGVDAAVEHLRFGGGSCWICDATIHHWDDVSLVVQEAPVGSRAGFVHFRCGPPQYVDDRRSRRAAIALSRRFEDRATDAQAFAVLRSYPMPTPLLIVSLVVGVTSRAENGDLTNPWLDRAVTEGLVPLAPDVFDVVPDVVPGWSLRILGDRILCSGPGGPWYDGGLEMPDEWLHALASQRQCVVVATGRAVDSSVIGAGFEPAVNMLASKGLVVGGAVEVHDLLTLNTALGLEAALAEARGRDALMARATRTNRLP